MKKLMDLVLFSLLISSCSKNTPSKSPNLLSNEEDVVSLSEINVSVPSSGLMDGLGQNLDFGSLAYKQSAIQEVIISNNSLSADLSFVANDIVLSGSFFSMISNDCARVIKPRAKCSIKLSLSNSNSNTATDISATGSLSIRSAMFPLSGVLLRDMTNYTAPIANVSVSPTTLNFGSMKPGEVKELSVIVKNNNTVSTDILFVPVNNGKINWTNSCGSSLASRKSCSFKAKYSASTDENILAQPLASIANNALVYSVNVSTPSVSQPSTLNVSPSTASVSVNLTAPSPYSGSIVFTNNGTETMPSPISAVSSHASVSINSVSCSSGLQRGKTCSVSYSINSELAPVGSSSQNIKLQSGIIASQPLAINLTITQPLPSGPDKMIITAKYGQELWVSDGTSAGTTILKDIRPGSSNNGEVGGAYKYINGKVFFRGSTGSGSINEELWVTDGTTNGTVLVKDFYGTVSSSPTHFMKLNDSTVLYVAASTNEGYELYKSDGTSAGTVLVKDINPGSASAFQWDSIISASLNNKVVFSAYNGYSRNIFVSDGTANGTIKLPIESLISDDCSNYDNQNTSCTDLSSNYCTYAPILETQSCSMFNGNESGCNFESSGQCFFDFPLASCENFGSDEASCYNYSNGSCFFDSESGSCSGGIYSDFAQYWSQGTCQGGTFQIDNGFGECSGGSFQREAIISVQRMVEMNGMAYFVAKIENQSLKLYKTDGTAQGTQLVKQISSNTPNLVASEMYAVNNKLYFSTTDGFAAGELWVSDGTTAGTQIINSEVKQAYHVTALNSTQALFSGYIGNKTNKRELWITDGTIAGTSLLKDIKPSDLNFGSYPRYFTKMGNKLYFAADDGVNGAELWVTDGTSAGTLMLKNIHSSGSSSPSELTLFKNKIYFSATTAANGTELWVTDGTSDGTVLLKDIAPSTQSGLPISPLHFKAIVAE